MKSGIYVLRFKSGHYYIGKSDDIQKRWEQHWTDLCNGKHAKKIQECFNRDGFPVPEVFLECHSDHIDLYESIIIRMNLGPMCLNTSLPREVPPDDVTTLMSNAQWIKFSTAEHFRMLHRLDDILTAKLKEVDLLQLRVDELEKSGIQIPEETKDTLEDREAIIEYMQTDIDCRQSEIDNLKIKLKQMKSRNLLERIFNLWV